MLTQEPIPDSETRRPISRNGPSASIKLMLTLVFLIVLVLRHDYWQWDTPYPLLFGFLPVGLWWQGLVSVLAAGMMWLMVHFAWPAGLEEDALEWERLRHASEPAASSAPSSDLNSNGNPKPSPVRSTNLTR